MIVVALTNCEGNDISALQIQNCAEIDFLAFGTIFHLVNIGTPLLIYIVGIKFSIEYIFCCNFRSGPVWTAGMQDAFCG